MTESSNFDLQIDKIGGDRFRARVTSPRLGGGHHDFDPPFAGQEWEDLLSRYRLREIQAVSEKTVESIGRHLFESVFSGDVLNLWRAGQLQAEPSRLCLRIDSPESATWPWELLCDPKTNSPLALATPVIRHPEIPVRIRPLCVRLPLRVLVVIAVPSECTPLESQEEWEKLRRALGDLEKKREVHLVLLEGASLQRLNQLLRESFHILHFIGHGTFDRQRQEGCLIFDDGHGGADRVSGRDLAVMIRGREDLRLVVLNACEGARGGSDAFAGVADSLVRTGVPAVVAMQTPIADRAAVLFAQSFYEEVASARPIDLALTEARRALHSADRQGIEWAIPVLFLRSPDGRLFLPPTSTNFWVSLFLLIATLPLLSPQIWSPPNREVTPQESSIAQSPLPPPIFTLPPTATMEGCPKSGFLDMEFVRISAGTFQMGSKPRDRDELRHQVTLSKPFCMSVHEVTRGQWKKVMGSVPGDSEQSDDLPVTGVSWEEIDGFIRKLSELEGVTYRLPTEAEWEYAARVGSERLFSFGDDPDDLSSHGNCKSILSSDSFDKLAPPCSFQANPWGLCDMHGNASEWVQDWYAPYPEGPVTDPSGPDTGDKRVRRGGSFDIRAKNCNAVSRNQTKPDERLEDVGFRLVREVEP